MSIENKILRNAERNQTLFDQWRILTPNEEQKSLTQKWIVPYADAIVGDSRSIREKVDRALQKDPEVRKKLRLAGSRYPLGMCDEVCEGFFELMTGELLNSDRPGMQAVKNFVRAGGVVRPFWGIDKNLYFQNAIQIGDSILDVANDTVDRTKDPVVLYPSLREAPFKNIDSITEFADIAERYWKDYEVYPNIYLPTFAPVYPILSVKRVFPQKGPPADTLNLESQVGHLQFINTHTLRDGHLLGLSSDFLFESPYSEKRLPPDIEKALFSEKNKLFSGLRSEFPDIFGLSVDPNDAKAAIERFHVPPGEKQIPLQYLYDIEGIANAGETLSKRPLAIVDR